jgi:hypothetical protein
MHGLDLNLVQSQPNCLFELTNAVCLVAKTMSVVTYQKSQLFLVKFPADGSADYLQRNKLRNRGAGVALRGCSAHRNRRSRACPTSDRPGPFSPFGQKQVMTANNIVFGIGMIIQLTAPERVSPATEQERFAAIANLWRGTDATRELGVMSAHVYATIK